MDTTRRLPIGRMRLPSSITRARSTTALAEASGSSNSSYPSGGLPATPRSAVYWVRLLSPTSLSLILPLPTLPSFLNVALMPSASSSINRSRHCQRSEYDPVRICRRAAHPACHCLALCIHLFSRSFVRYIVSVPRQVHLPSYDVRIFLLPLPLHAHRSLCCVQSRDLGDGRYPLHIWVLRSEHYRCPLTGVRWGNRPLRVWYVLPFPLCLRIHRYPPLLSIPQLCLPVCPSFSSFFVSVDAYIGVHIAT